jgi:hypothetical protein
VRLPGRAGLNRGSGGDPQSRERASPVTW